MTNGWSPGFESNVGLHFQPLNFVGEKVPVELVLMIDGRDVDDDMWVQIRGGSREGAHFLEDHVILICQY